MQFLNHRLLPGMFLLALSVCRVTAAGRGNAAGDGPQVERRPPPEQGAAVRRPPGWRLVFEKKFDRPGTLAGFEFANPEKWRWREIGGDGCLETLGPGRYRPPVRAPRTIALISGKRFTDFILEADLMQTGREYPHRDMCIFFGVQSPSRFYYVHLATRADAHAHNIFIVRDKPRRAIASFVTHGIQWGRNRRHHVRVERHVDSGDIAVYFDDLEHPIMKARDATFRAGLIGFGSFDDSGLVDNVRIWAPGPPEAAPPVFPQSREPRQAQRSK